MNPSNDTHLKSPLSSDPLPVVVPSGGLATGLIALFRLRDRVARSFLSAGQWIRNCRAMSVSSRPAGAKASDGSRLSFNTVFGNASGASSGSARSTRSVGNPGASASRSASASGAMNVGILRHGVAMRVVFYYPGEEGAYVDQATVTLFENGIVHVKAPSEETTTHLSHCEILWKFEVPEGAGTSNLRLLKFPENQNNNAPKN